MPLETLTFRKFASSADLNAALADLLREAIAAPDTGPSAIMLSGGSTPRGAYAALAAAPVAAPPQRWITYTDERHVPEDDPESNHGQTRALLEAIGVPSERILRADTSLPLADCAARLDADYAAFFAAGGAIPLAILGLGADGHTCSLFSEADVTGCGDAFAAPVLRPAPPHRITVGPALLQRVARIVFVVAGRDKDDVVEQFRTAPSWLPAGVAVAGCARLELWNA